VLVFLHVIGKHLSYSVRIGMTEFVGLVRVGVTVVAAVADGGDADVH